MAEDSTPALVAEAVRCVRELSCKVQLSAEERSFVNEQASALSDQIMQSWAKGRYGGKKRIRPCCVGLALAVALDVAHKMSLPGDGLGGDHPV